MPTLNLDDYGKITYTIDKSGVIGPDDYVTMKLTFKPSVKMYGYYVYLHNPYSPNQGANYIFQGDKTISKGGSGSVTLEFKPALYMVSKKWFTERNAQMLLSVHMVISTSDDSVSSDIFDTGITVLKERIAPEIASHSFQETRIEDTTGIVVRPGPEQNLPLDIFGTFVQIASSPKLVANVILDPLDPALTAQHSLTLKQGENTLFSLAESVSGSSVKILTGNIAVAGQVDYEYIVTDSAGMSSSVSGSFNVLEYALPVINKAIPKRYAYEYDSSGNEVLVESEQGTIVRIEFSAAMTAISGNGNNNTGTLTVVYGSADDESDRTSIEVMSGVTVAGIDTFITFDDVVFSDAQDYVFEVEWADMFRSVKSTSNIYAAGADFEVTPDGVSVGMVSGGTSEDKRFEVAETHESHFYGGIAGVTNYPDFRGADGTITLPQGMEVATGGRWIDGKPIYRYMWKGTTSLSGKQGVVCTLPDGEPDTVITLRGMFRRESDRAWFAMPNIYYGSVDWAVNMRTDSSGGITCGFGDQYSGSRPIIVIVEYTKK